MCMCSSTVSTPRSMKPGSSARARIAPWMPRSTRCWLAERSKSPPVRVVADPGERHGVVAVEPHPAGGEPVGLEVVVGERRRVADRDAADVVDHVLEEREPADEDVVGLDADHVADGLAEQLRAAVVESGVDPVRAVARDADVGVARDADGGRRAGLGVHADQLQGVAAHPGHVLTGPGVGADRQDPDQVGVDVDAAGPVDLDQHRLGGLDAGVGDHQPAHGEHRHEQGRLECADHPLSLRPHAFPLCTS